MQYYYMYYHSHFFSVNSEILFIRSLNIFANRFSLNIIHRLLDLKSGFDKIISADFSSLPVTRKRYETSYTIQIQTYNTYITYIYLFIVFKLFMITVYIGRSTLNVIVYRYRGDIIVKVHRTRRQRRYLAHRVRLVQSPRVAAYVHTCIHMYIHTYVYIPIERQSAQPGAMRLHEINTEPALIYGYTAERKKCSGKATRNKMQIS